MQLDAPEREGRGGGSESNGDIKAGGREQRRSTWASLCEILGYRRKEKEGIWNYADGCSWAKEVLVLGEHSSTSALHQPGEVVC